MPDVLLDKFRIVISAMVADGLITTHDEGAPGGVDGLVFTPTDELIAMATEVGVDPEWLGTSIARYRLAQELDVNPDSIQMVATE